LDGRVPLIGFSGAPFTLASYLIEGGGSRNYIHTKKLMYHHPEAWHSLLTLLAGLVNGYLRGQVAAGAEAVQLFDSWVGCLSPDDYRRYVLPHTRAALAGIAPDTPVIYFGTGDRTDPTETDIVNRFYAVKNDWAVTTADLAESDLVDVTDDLIQLGTAAQRAAVQASLDAGKGWYIRLENPGEKVVASPRVYAGVVYFTTYTPPTTGGGDPGDPCAVSTVRGVARLYAVHYKTGASVHDFSSTVETNAESEVVELGKHDRVVALGTAIPSAPVIAILEGGARLFVGVEGGIVSMPTIETPDMHRYFWHQPF